MSGTVQPEAREVNVIARVENSNLEKILIRKTSQGLSQLELFTILSFLSPLCWSVAALFSLLFLKGLVKSWKSAILPDPSESVRWVRCFPFTIPILMGRMYAPFTSFPRKRAFLTQMNLLALYYLYCFPRVHLFLGTGFYLLCLTSSQYRQTEPKILTKLWELQSCFHPINCTGIL